MGLRLRLGRNPPCPLRPVSFPAHGWLGTLGDRFGLIDSMILPQVHLRKPCYDFSFL
jgi:hypothetical protein